MAVYRPPDPMYSVVHRGLARARAEGIPKAWLEALDRHGIRYVVYRGELFYEDGEIWKVLRLCREGKLPKGLC